MEWIFRGLSFAAILFIVKVVFQSKSGKETSNELFIKIPYHLRELGIVMTLMSSIGLMFISLVMKSGEDKVIVLSLFSLFILVFVFFIIIDHRFKIFIKKDSVLIRRLISSKEIDYSNVSFTVDGHNLILINSETSKKYYVNYSYNNTKVLMKHIENYQKQNKQKNTYSFNTVEGNFYTKNIGITYIFISLFLFLIGILLYVTASTKGEILFSLLFGGLLGLICFLFGTWFLLLYSRFYLRVDKDKLLRRNIFGITKKYSLNKLSLRKTKNGIKLYFNDRFLLYLNTWIFNNTLILEMKLKNSKK